MFKRCPSRGCEYVTHDAQELYCPTHREERLLVQLERDDRVGKYVVRESLRSNAGGMGTVYRAREAETHQNVALKVAHLKGYQYEAGNDEAACLRELDHPGVVRFRDRAQRHFMMGEPVNCLVMDWIHGKNLKTLLDEADKPPSPGEAARIVAKVAEALEHVHSRGFLHLDIKPGNIMLDARTGDPVVMDFGIARRWGDAAGQAPDRNLGTKGYMSPEHRENLPLDPRTDVYALGLVLYDLLSGKPGVGSEALAEGRPLTPLATFDPSLGKKWARVIAKATAGDREQRYADMTAFRRAVLKTSVAWRPPISVLIAAAAVVLLALLIVARLNGWFAGPGGGQPAAPATVAAPPIVAPSAAISSVSTAVVLEPSDTPVLPARAPTSTLVVK